VPAYLITPGLTLEVIRSKRYKGRWELADEGGSDFLFDEAAFKALKSPPPSAPLDCEEAFALEGGVRDLSDFETFFKLWRSGRAPLYRGMPGCHFAWDKLRKKKVLESEGKADVPTFTMGNSKPTRWLPATADFNLACGVGLSCLDEHTKRHLADKYVPVGITLEIPVGWGQGPALCWLNPGEIVVRGPLGSGQFSICAIVWLYPGNEPQYDRRSLPIDKLWPVRPYEPKSEDLILRWFERLKPWTHVRRI
jgi:hypothetical protein